MSESKKSKKDESENFIDTLKDLLEDPHQQRSHTCIHSTFDEVSILNQ